MDASKMVPSTTYGNFSTTRSSLASASNSLHSLAKRNLQNILQNPIHFVPATKLTFADESRMAPKLGTENMTMRPEDDHVSSSRPRRRSAGLDTLTSAGLSNNISGKPAANHVSSVWNDQLLRSRTSVGFENRGMHCYRNSVLQALIHAPKLVNWLTLSHNNCTLRGCVACCLAKLCRKYWNEPKDRSGIQRLLLELQARLKPTRAFKSCGFQWSRQHDAPEYYNNLVGALLETNPRLSEVIKPMLGHSLAIKMICPKCSDETRLTTIGNEDFVFSVKYKRAASLPKLLNVVSFGKNIVQGRRCERCKQVSDTPRVERLLTAPDLLLIQLHRFTEGKGLFGGIVKDTDPIPYPRELDMTSHTESGMELKYTLLSVINHLGSRESGHYKVVARGPDGTWDDIEDEVVRRTHVEAALEPGRPWTPYVLLYSKHETPITMQNLPDEQRYQDSANDVDQRNQQKGASTLAGKRSLSFKESDRHTNKKFRGNAKVQHRRHD